MNQEYLNLILEELELKNPNPEEDIHARAQDVAIRVAEFEKNHPEIRDSKDEYRKKALKILTTRRILEYFKELEPFNGDPDRIPDIPILPKDQMEEIIFPALIKAGAIPKENLIPGHTYIGSCRNSSEAIWNGKVFTYQRYKFGDTYPEDINHFQDDNGYDVFVPIIDKDEKTNK